MAGIDKDALVVLMQKDGFADTAFAHAVGISIQYLGDIKKGRRTLKRNPELITKMARALNVPRSMLEQHVCSDGQDAA